jgi:preprotein translocase subunit YajC
MFWTSVAYAQAAAGGAAKPSLVENLMPFVFILVIFYFFLIRPQAKKMKTHDQFITALKVGDQVITASGIFGTIAGITDEFVTLEVADDVKIRVVKKQVSTALKEGTKK